MINQDYRRVRPFAAIGMGMAVAAASALIFPPPPAPFHERRRTNLSSSYTKKGPGRSHRSGKPGNRPHRLVPREPVAPSVLARAAERRHLYRHSARGWYDFLRQTIDGVPICEIEDQTPA